MCMSKLCGTDGRITFIISVETVLHILSLLRQSRSNHHIGEVDSGVTVRYLSVGVIVIVSMVVRVRVIVRVRVTQRNGDCQS